MHTTALEKPHREARTVTSRVLGASIGANQSGFAGTTAKSRNGVNWHLLFSLVSLFCILASVGLIAVSPSVPVAVSSRGRVRVDGVGIYEDLDCSTVVMSIDWGTLKPGSSHDSAFYVRNEGNHVASIFMRVGNWDPVSASRYMSLSWNYNGRKLSPSEVVKITIGLHVSSDVESIADFSFDITIGATSSNSDF